MFVASKAPLCTFHQPSYGQQPSYAKLWLCQAMVVAMVVAIFQDPFCCSFPPLNISEVLPMESHGDHLDMARHSTGTIGDLQLHMSSRDEAHARRGLVAGKVWKGLTWGLPGPQLPHQISPNISKQPAALDKSRSNSFAWCCRPASSVAVVQSPLITINHHSSPFIIINHQ